MRKLRTILIQVIPIVVMIGLIPVIKNDYALSAVCLVIIIIGSLIRRERHDLMFLIIGFAVMIIAESFFISTGVEIFTRTTLFGVMPLYLPFIWAYAFMVIKRSVKIIEK